MTRLDTIWSFQHNQQVSMVCFGIKNVFLLTTYNFAYLFLTPFSMFDATQLHVSFIIGSK